MNIDLRVSGKFTGSQQSKSNHNVLDFTDCSQQGVVGNLIVGALSE
jgi:hypothetical protein